MIYLITFFSTLLFISIALKFRFTSKKTFIIFSIMGLIIPCILAGLRDYTIGTDVKVYVEPLYRVSKHFDNFKAYINGTGSDVHDYGYLFITFISGKIWKDISLLFFICEFLTIVPIYKALLNFSKSKTVIVVGLFIFFMTLYNLSLNMVRQSISISFSLLSYSYFVKKNYKFSIINFIIAFLFHKSCIMLIPILALYNFFKKYKPLSKKLVGVKLLIVFLVTIVVVFLPSLLKIFINLKILDSEHFGKIIEKFSQMDINYIRTTWYFIFFIIVYLNRKQLKNKIENYDFYTFLSFISIFILQLGAVIRYSERIGYYYLYIVLFFAIPISCDSEKKQETYKTSKSCLIVITIFFIYWVYWSIYIKSNQTYPYIFR